MSNARKLADNLPTEGQLGDRNLLINSGFSISQRGDYTSATSVSNDTYYVDRWKVRLSGVSANIQHIKGSNSSPNHPNIGSNTLKLTATSTASGILRHLQQVEGFLKGRELTFSAWVKSNSSDARLFQYQHGSSNRVASSAHTGGGGWEKLIVTATNNATSNNQLYFDAAIASSSFANVSIASGDYIEIAEPQLEFGSQSTPFEHEPMGVTLIKSQRYYFQSPSYSAGSSGTGADVILYHTYTKSASNWEWLTQEFPVIMRANPTVTCSDGATDGKIGHWTSGGGGSTQGHSPWQVLSKTNHIRVNEYATSGIYGFYYNYKADAEL